MPLRDSLIALRNADGGWPYYAGRASRLEPTCWALLALAQESGTEPAVDRIGRWPQADGWLVDVPGAPVNFGFNALAGLTLLQHQSGVERARAIATKLLAVKGIRLEQTPILRQDNSLQAWPWIDGTFSWVEPTAWTLLLLKHGRAEMRAAGAGRIAVGERMLIDRACRGGGWNYGSSNVYGQELWAYVPTTALGLLALQDRRGEPVVAQSLDLLRKDVGNERSAVALALAAIALRIYGAPPGELPKLLAAATAVSQESGSVLGMAMSVYATADSRRPMNAFAIGT